MLLEIDIFLSLIILSLSMHFRLILTTKVCALYGNVSNWLVHFLGYIIHTGVVMVEDSGMVNIVYKTFP